MDGLGVDYGGQYPNRSQLTSLQSSLPGLSKSTGCFGFRKQRRVRACGRVRRWPVKSSFGCCCLSISRWGNRSKRPPHPLGDWQTVFASRVQLCPPPPQSLRRNDDAAPARKEAGYRQHRWDSLALACSEDWGSVVLSKDQACPCVVGQWLRAG